MSATAYLLPCSCGRNLQVEIGQAGDQLPCPCGLVVEVPAMREIRKLAPATDISVTKVEQPEWDARRGVMFLASVLAFVGVSGLGFMWSRLPARPTFDVPALVQAEQRNIDKMTVSDSWMYWLREIEGPGLTKFPNPQDDHYEKNLQSSRFGMTFFAGLALVGVIVGAGAQLWSSPAKKGR